MGAIVAGYYDLEFHLKSYAWAMVSCVLGAGNLTMMKLVSTSKEQATASEILFANSSLSVVFLLIVSQPHTRMGPLRITIHGAVANHDSLLLRAP